MGWMRKALRRRAALAFAAFAVSLALVSGLTQAGNRYFYCEAMGMLQHDPCAEAPRADDSAHSSNAPVAKRGDCCEIVTFPSLPEGSTASSPSVSPPALIALVPASELGEHSTDGLAWRVAPLFERWRLPPPTAAQRRVELMVFLT